MGLRIGVRWLARTAEEGDLEELELLREPFDALNAVLVEAGMAPQS